VRVTTADAYLRPGAQRTGLTVLTDTVVDRLVTAGGRVTRHAAADGDGPHEVGVDEMVLTVSAIGSPTILLLP
jgi:choline dehydrogenase-like flavoprotein